MPISSYLGSSALLPAGLGFRNKIINGDFGINQRGFSSSTTDGTFGFDRWYFSYSGGTVTYSSQPFTAGNAISGQEPKTFARITTSGQSTSGHLSLFTQKIESVRTCAGQQIVISFWAKADSGTPKIAIELEQNFGSGGSPSSAVTTYCGQVTLSTSWTRQVVIVNVPSINGKTIGTTNDGFLQLTLWTSAGSNFNARTGSLGVQNNTIDLWGVQLEQNNQPTPFEQRPIGVELALCQRYYERVTDPSASGSAFKLIGSGGWDSDSQFSLSWLFQSIKRASPTIFTPATGINLLYHGVAWWGASSVGSYTEITLTGVRINFVSSGAAVRGQAGIAVLASSTAYIEANAEL